MLIEELKSFNKELKNTLDIVNKIKAELNTTVRAIASSANKIADSFDEKKIQKNLSEAVKNFQKSEEIAKEAQKAKQIGLQVDIIEKRIHEEEVKISKELLALEKAKTRERAITYEATKLQQKALKEILQEEGGILLMEDRIDEVRTEGLEKAFTASREFYKSEAQRLRGIKSELKGLMILRSKLAERGLLDDESAAKLDKRIEELRADFEKTDKLIRETEQSVGEFFRNVGNYTESIKGAFNQLGGEFLDLGGAGASAFASVGKASGQFALSLKVLFERLIHIRRDGFGGLKAAGAASFIALTALVGSVVSFIGNAFGSLKESISDLFEAGMAGITNFSLESFKAVKRSLGGLRDLEREYNAVTSVTIKQLQADSDLQRSIADNLAASLDDRLRASRESFRLQREALLLEENALKKQAGFLETIISNTTDAAKRAEFAEKLSGIKQRLIEINTELQKIPAEAKIREAEIRLEELGDSVDGTKKGFVALFNVLERGIDVSKSMEEIRAEIDNTAKGVKELASSVSDNLRQFDDLLKTFGVDSGGAFAKLAQKIKEGKAEQKDFVEAAKLLQKIPYGGIFKEAQSSFEDITDVVGRANEQLNNLRKSFDRLSKERAISDLQLQLELLKLGLKEDLEAAKKIVEEGANIGRIEAIAVNNMFSITTQTIKDRERQLVGLMRLLKFTREELERRKDEIRKELDERLAIIDKEREIEMKRNELIEDARERENAMLLTTAKFRKLRLDAIEEANKKELELEKEFTDERRKILVEEAQNLQGFIDQSINFAQQRLEQQANLILQQNESLQNALQVQAILASKGLANSMAEVEAKIRANEAAARERQRRQERLAKIQSYFNALVEYMKQDPNTAPFRALIQIALAEAIAGRFAHGVENFKGKGGQKDDKNLVLISAGESIITAEGTNKYKGLATAMNQGKVEQWIQNNYGTQVAVDFTELGEWIVREVNKAKRTIHVYRPRRTPF